MSAKSKAFQAMAVLGIVAVTYTVYNSSSDRPNTKPSAKEQTNIPIVITTKAPKKKTPASENTVPSTQYAVPGYSNPDEITR